MSLRKATERGLIRMIARNLEGTPSSSEIQLVAGVYVDDFENRGLCDDDADRVTAAFEAVGQRAYRFPSPAAILEALPKREPPKMITHEITDDERRENLARLDRMLKEAGLRR